MSICALFFVVFFSLHFAFPDSKYAFKAAGPGDIRSPCPGWNALANHGYINRDGRNIASKDFVNAVQQVFGLATSITQLAVNNAQNVAGVFGSNGVIASLDLLSRTHNVIEHDASLTRQDLALGDNVGVDPQLVKQLVSGFSVMRKGDLADKRTLRIRDSKRRNSNFTWKLLTQQPVAAGESAFLHLIFGRGNGTVPTSVLGDFLLNERLPQGWSKRPSEISFLEFTALTSYFLALEVVSMEDSGLTAAQIQDLAEVSVKRYYS